MWKWSYLVRGRGCWPSLFDQYDFSPGKSDRYKEKEKNGRDSPAEKKPRKHENRDSESDYKHSSKQSSARSSNSNSSKKHSEVKVNKHWVRPYLKVKIIDRRYKEGRYYSSKVIVDDVLPGSIVCKTDTGRLLEGETQKFLSFCYYPFCHYLCPDLESGH